MPPEAGAPAAEYVRFLPDGRLFSKTMMVNGVEHGPFTVYHPDGRIAREGRFENGRLEGVVRGFTSPDPRSAPLRKCCVPATAVRLEEQFRRGEFLAEIFYDAQGRELRADGTPCPPRPPGLPEFAVFAEARKGWIARLPETSRLWNADGRLLEEIEHTDGGGQITRTFDASGELVEEQTHAADGRQDGPFRRRFPSGAPTPYANARIREERGAWAAGQPVGRWTFLDQGGQVLATAARGLPLQDGDLDSSPAFRDQLGDGWAVAGELESTGRVREALCAAARAAAREGAASRLRQWLDERIVPLAPAARQQTAEELGRISDLTPAMVLSALLGGTDPAAGFRTLASVLAAQSAAALDLVDASLLLAPERRATFLTRALIRAHRGDEAGARADVAMMETEQPDAAVSLIAYMRVVFRPADPFPPAGAPLPVPVEIAENVAVGQPLESIQRIAGVYATRLDRARRALRAMGISPEVPWFPADVTGLLPDGPLSLLRERITCDVDPDAPPGTAPDIIEVDEEAGLEDRAPAGAVLAMARADQAALGWLCWAVGMDTLGLPRAIEPRPSLPAAIEMIVKRYWRARDQSTTNGLLSARNNVPGFEWQGMDIDRVPPHLGWMVTTEYQAVRSMFLWLVTPDTLTPFQDDIRDA